MKPEEYCKTVVYNGHMVNIGVDDYGQQFFLEYVDENGHLTEFCLGAYNTNYRDALEYLFGPLVSIEGDDEGISYAENVLKKALKPKSEPEIVGEWIPSNPETDTLECSECGYNIISEELKTPYCPWCGAKIKNWEE